MLSVLFITTAIITAAAYFILFATHRFRLNIKKLKNWETDKFLLAFLLTQAIFTLILIFAFQPAVGLHTVIKFLLVMLNAGIYLLTLTEAIHLQHAFGAIATTILFILVLIGVFA